MRPSRSRLQGVLNNVFGFYFFIFCFVLFFFFMRFFSFSTRYFFRRKTKIQSHEYLPHKGNGRSSRLHVCNVLRVHAFFLVKEEQYLVTHLCIKCHHVGRAGTGEACLANGATSTSSLSTSNIKRNKTSTLCAEPLRNNLTHHSAMLVRATSETRYCVHLLLKQLVS